MSPKKRNKSKQIHNQVNKNAVFNDMHINLVFLGGVGMTAFGTMAAILHKDGWEQAISELGSMATHADINLVLGGVSALAVGCFWMVYSMKQGKTCCDPKMFSPRNMKASLIAMLSIVPVEYFFDYFSRVSYHIVKSTEDKNSSAAEPVNTNYGTAIFLNSVLTTVFTFVTMHTLTSGIFGCMKVLRANFADDKIFSGMYALAAGGGMAGLMSYDYFGISLPRLESIAVQGLLTGAGAVSTTGLALALFKCCTADDSDEDEEAAARRPLISENNINDKVEEEEETDQDHWFSCDFLKRIPVATGSLFRKK